MKKLPLRTALCQIAIILLLQACEENADMKHDDHEFGYRNDLFVYSIFSEKSGVFPRYFGYILADEKNHYLAIKGMTTYYIEFVE